MPIVNTRVDAISRFPELRHSISELARVAVAEGAAHGASVASSVASQRSRTGRMAAIRVDAVTGTPDGWAASFTSPVYYSWHQNYGTLGNRSKPLKQPSRGHRTREAGTGITPLRFLDAGRSAGRKQLLSAIGRGLPR